MGEHFQHRAGRWVPGFESTPRDTIAFTSLSRICALAARQLAASIAIEAPIGFDFAVRAASKDTLGEAWERWLDTAESLVMTLDARLGGRPGAPKDLNDQARDFERVYGGKSR